VSKVGLPSCGHVGEIDGVASVTLYLEGHSGGFFKETDDTLFAASARSHGHYLHQLTDFSTSVDYGSLAQAISSRHSERKIV
jgi:hypothetical protein